MKRMSFEEFKDCIEKRSAGKVLDLSCIELTDADLTGFNLKDIKFSLSAFERVTFNNADLSRCEMENALFDGCSFRSAKFDGANMRGASMRCCDMSGSSIRGADLFCAVLEKAKLDSVIVDEHTKWFRMHCPETGAFLGYKKCVNDRLVRLLIPAEAKRTSATLPSCRCSKAKVLSIQNFEGTEEFEEAWSLVDENFVYRKGQWVEVPDFNEDRFMDSTTGIHFWMSREEAIGY